MLKILLFIVIGMISCIAGMVLVQRAIQRKNDALRKSSSTHKTFFVAPPKAEKRPSEKQDDNWALAQHENFVRQSNTMALMQMMFHQMNQK